jgi:tricorn protease
VPQHAELAWVFNCVARIGWMNRMTQFKDKAGKDRENASLGLLAYPSLMAADILVYRATHVPVGEDQKQHLELTRDIAAKFNHDFASRIAALGVGEPMQMGEETVNGFFPLTEPLIEGPATRVMSLRDGTKKMSKSDPSDLSRINLTDDADAISKKIRKAKTDPEPLPSELEGLKGRPEADNLVGIYAALADTTPEKVISEFGGQQFSVFKPALADLAVAGAGTGLLRDAPHLGRPRPCRPGPARRRRTRRRAGRSDHEDGARDRRVSEFHQRLIRHDPSLDPVERQHRVAGNARQIWIYDPATRRHTRLPETHDALAPAWGPDGRSLYFVGEASGTLNVWAHDFESGESRQLTHHADRPVRFLSASLDGDLAYAQGGTLHLLRAGESESRPIELRFSERLMSQPTRQAATLKSEFVTSPDGALMAAVVDAEIVLIDRRGNTRQLTATSDPEKDVTFSPDGTKLVYAAQRDRVWGIYGIDLQREEFGDELALVFQEVPLVVGEENAFQPAFSPDGQKLAYVHARREIKVLDLDTGEIKEPFSPDDYITSYMDGDIWFSWSPDARHLLVSWKTVPFAAAAKAGIVPADASEPIRAVTASVPNIERAWFSSDGSQILASTTLFGLRTADQMTQFTDFYRIFMSDEARADFLAAEGTVMSDGGYNFQDERNSYLESRLTGESAAHITSFPVPDSPHMLTVAVDMGGSASLFALNLHRGDMERILSLDDLPADFLSYVPAKNAVDLVVPGGILTISLEDTDQRQFVPVSLEMTVDHRGRREAAFDQIWADLKFKYYRADIEGRDWDAIGDHYRGYLDSIVSDREFSQLIAEMFGEISGSHMFVSYRPPETGANLGTRTASLGIFRDDEYVGAGLRIAAILPGGPLDRDDLGVAPGDVILSVEGRLIPDVGGIDRALDGMADRPIKIGVVSPEEDDERQITVRPVSLAVERTLNHQRWVDTRRDLVAERSRECVVYAYLRNMDNDGFLEAYGRLLSARDSAGAALVDVRSNHGGNLHRQLLTLLDGRAFAQVGREDRAWAMEPLNQWIGPSAVLMDSYSYSDGSVFPQAYQDLGLGPVVGDRLVNTGTGVNYVASLVVPGLTYGIPVQPFRRMDGSYYENSEVVPDIEIGYDPNVAHEGRDLKLEAAVDVLIETLGSDRNCR